MTKNYVDDVNCRVFDTYEKIKQCWEHISKLYDEGKAIPFTKRPNEFGGEDLFLSVKRENGIYIISMGNEGEIKKIVRF